jgi:hypothetical protein
VPTRIGSTRDLAVPIGAGRRAIVVRLSSWF